MKETQLRFYLFAVWSIIFIIYVLMFLVVGRFNFGVNPDDARAAAWRAAYTLLPVLSAFGAFWFTLDNDQAASAPDEPVAWDRVCAAFILTFMVHGIVLTYFVMYVATVEFSLSPEPGESFTEVVDWGMNVLGVLSAVVLLPVSYILKRPDLRILATRQGAEHGATGQREAAAVGTADQAATA